MLTLSERTRYDNETVPVPSVEITIAVSPNIRENVLATIITQHPGILLPQTNPFLHQCS
jgi:hypothetical protein